MAEILVSIKYFLHFFRSCGEGFFKLSLGDDFRFRFFDFGDFLKKQSPGGGFIGLENGWNKQYRSEKKKDGKSEEDCKGNFAQIIKSNACRDKNDKCDSGDRQKNDSGDDTYGDEKKSENDRVADVFEE